MGKKQKKSKRLPIMEQVILLAKEYKCNIIESKKMNKILSYIGGVYFFLFVIYFLLKLQKDQLTSQSMEVILILTLFLLICMLYSYFLTRILVRKAKKLHLTQLKVFVEKRKVPLLLTGETLATSCKDDVIQKRWTMNVDKKLYHVMHDIVKSICWKDSSNRRASYFSSIDLTNVQDKLKERIFVFRNDLSCEVSSPSEKNRKKYLKDLEELESFFSSF